MEPSNSNARGMEPSPPPAVVQTVASFPQVQIGGEWRVRVEHQDAPDSQANEDRQRVLQRVMLHADVRWSPALRTFVELADTRAFDGYPVSTADESGFDLQTAFVQADVAPGVQVTAGRQGVAFDQAQRFVSFREGPGVRRAFDAVRASFSREDWRIEAVASRPVRNGPEDFDDRPNTAVGFNALYLTQTRENSTRGAYLFDYSNDNARFSSGSGRERRWTVGMRAAGADGAWDYDVETAYQFGDFGSKTISAWALASVVGYTTEAPMRPRLWLELELGSGDQDPRDGRLETFNPLFPNGGVFNQFSLTSWANLGLVRGGVVVKPRSDLKLGVSVAGRFQLETADGIYLNPLTPLSGTAGATQNWAGAATRIDLDWLIRDDLVMTGQVLWSQAEGALAAAQGSSAVYAFVAVKKTF